MYHRIKPCILLLIIITTAPGCYRMYATRTEVNKTPNISRRADTSLVGTWNMQTVENSRSQDQLESGCLVLRKNGDCVLVAQVKQDNKSEFLFGRWEGFGNGGASLTFANNDAVVGLRRGDDLLFQFPDAEVIFRQVSNSEFGITDRTRNDARFCRDWQSNHCEGSIRYDSPVDHAAVTLHAERWFLFEYREKENNRKFTSFGFWRWDGPDRLVLDEYDHISKSRLEFGIIKIQDNRLQFQGDSSRITLIPR